MKHSITLFIDKAEEMIREVSDIANLSNDNISNFAHALELWLIKAEQLFNPSLTGKIIFHKFSRYFV